MGDYPLVRVKENSLRVSFAPNAKGSSPRPLDMVLDFGQWGDVTGIEVINLLFQMGKNCLGIVAERVPTEGEPLRYAYDEACDCFYLHLRTGRSFDQKTVQGLALLDEDGRITELGVEWR
jgi:hypothetical protein